MNSIAVQIAIDNFQQLLISAWLVIPRMSTFLLISAFLSRGSISGLVRGSLILGLSTFALPMVYETANHFALSLRVEVAGLFIKELFLGLCFGYLASVGFWAVETAGFFVDNQRGAAIANIINPFSSAETSLLGMLFVQIAIIYFFTSGLFLKLLGMFYTSFNYWPPLSFYPNLTSSQVQFWLSSLDNIMKTGLLISSPLILCMLVSELGLAFANRFAPQLQVFFLAITVKTGVAFLILVPYFYTLVNYIYTSLMQFEHLIYKLFILIRS